MQRALSRKLIGRQAARELLAVLSINLPRLECPASPAAWRQQAARVRRQLLKSFFRGHPPGLLDAPVPIQWGATIRAGQGYSIRKLRYEGYPGMWIPALLYEPDGLRVKAPAVLNANGHHAGGKAMDYKQARCINLAKRGMLALSTEFIGMGELRRDPDHHRIAHLDLCGVAGIGIFYLAMKRGLDALLAHPHCDPERVAMTGLSGGGWQTVVLAALDERVKVVVPVAGYSAVWQRIGHLADIGDYEQVPADMCTVADYDTLTGMFAPRPSLLIYNRRDDCCFPTRRARRSVYQPGRTVFSLMGADDKISFYDNVDPGTHNYETLSRGRLYRFLNQHWDLDTPDTDLPFEDEILTESELEVGLPPDNATLLSLAQKALVDVRRERAAPRRRSAAAARRRLAELLRLPEFDRVTSQEIGSARQLRGATVRQHVLVLGDTWSVPVTELIPPTPRGVELIVGEGGRGSALALVAQALAARRRVLVADIFGTGEARTTPHYHMLLTTAGQRPLGLQVGQLGAVIQWVRKHCRARRVGLQASGELTSVAALAAAALAPEELAWLETTGLPDSLDRLIEWPVAFADAAPLFCFGLRREFDVPDLIELAAPVPLQDHANRGPLTRRQER